MNFFLFLGFKREPDGIHYLLKFGNKPPVDEISSPGRYAVSFILYLQSKIVFEETADVSTSDSGIHLVNVEEAPAPFNIVRKYDFVKIFYFVLYILN